MNSFSLFLQIILFVLCSHSEILRLTFLLNSHISYLHYFLPFIFCLFFLENFLTLIFQLMKSFFRSIKSFFFKHPLNSLLQWRYFSSPPSPIGCFQTSCSFFILLASSPSLKANGDSVFLLSLFHNSATSVPVLNVLTFAVAGHTYQPLLANNTLT